MNIEKRKLQEIKGSYLVTLPKKWVSNCELEKGSIVDIILTEGGALEIHPIFTEDKSLKKKTIFWDENASVRLANFYFNGIDIIEVKVEGGINKKQRAEVFSLLPKLINVEIIEESSDRLVLQNFGCRNFSIQQAFKRQYLLVKSMFDDVLEGKVKELEERDNQVDKFYFLVVMLIRSNLTRGKYLSDDSIKLIKIMDYRTASEKLERIADELKNVKKMKTKKETEFAKKVSSHFDEIVTAFIKNDFERSLEIRKEHIQLKEQAAECEGIKRILFLCKDIIDLIS